MNHELEPRIFLTDYASYNDGTQFEFGHWVDLDDFSDEDELNEYIDEHFKKADKKRPLCSPREEIMITDYEGIPKELYSESSMDFGNVYTWLNLNIDDKVKIEFLLEQGEDFNEAIEKYENVSMFEYEPVSENLVRWELFEQLYPEQEEMANENEYLSVDYDAFIRDNYTKFQSQDGTYYFVDNGWY